MATIGEATIRPARGEDLDEIRQIELQLSIDPAFARRRIGQRLIDEVDRWAADQQHQEVTLTTFRDVPWNAPYYARLGFRAVDGAELTPALVELLAVEASHGLDPAQRVVMRRAVTREPFA